MSSTARNSLRHCLALAALLLALMPGPVLAASTQQTNKKPIEIRADHATFKQKAGTGVYQGHAEMIQGNRHLYADTIHLFTKDGHLVRVVAIGNPAHMVEGDELDATARKATYNLQTGMLVLTGNAHVKNQGNTIDGAQVTYNLNSKRVEASGEDGKRVRMVIPAQNEEPAQDDDAASSTDPAPDAEGDGS